MHTQEKQAGDALAAELGAQIAGGRIGPGVRLPAERELAHVHGTSRVTLRHALARLIEWGLIRVKRGSGSVACDRREWSFAVLPLALRSAKDPRALLEETLSLRRDLVLHATMKTKGRLRAGALNEARAAIELADHARGDARAFVLADLEMMRAVLAAAELWTTLWLVNDLTRPYLDLIGPWAMPPVPADYRATHLAYFEALEAGDVLRAGELIGDYLARLDGALLGGFG